MGGMLDALNAGRTSLEVNQKQIEVAGNNIANVNTEGYSRQVVDLSPYPALKVGGFFIGNGVQITDVKREFDVFITNQLIESSVDYGYENSKTSTFTELENIFPVTEDNLATEMDTFFDRWQELATDPTDIVLRDMVIQQGNVLADEFNATATQLDQVQANISDKVLASIDEVNSQLSQVAELNERIYNIEINNQTANSARDERDLLIKDLAQTLGAEYYELPNGMINLQLPAGLPLVNATQSMEIEGVTDGLDVTLVLHAAGVTRKINDYNLGGEFSGLMELKDEFIPSLENDLDSLAYNFINQINDLHTKGAGLNGTTGVLFFDVPPNAPEMGVDNPNDPVLSAARTMKVSITKATQVAAASAPPAGEQVQVGDNTNALAIADLSYTATMDGTDTFDSYYALMASNIGISSNQNQLNLTGAQDAMVQVENLRDGYSGVSLEEEMIDLIQFQRAFQSSAKFLSTVDEMMEDLIAIR